VRVNTKNWPYSSLEKSVLLMKVSLFLKFLEEFGVAFLCEFDDVDRHGFVRYPFNIGVGGDEWRLLFE